MISCLPSSIVVQKLVVQAAVADLAPEVVELTQTVPQEVALPAHQLKEIRQVVTRSVKLARTRWDSRKLSCSNWENMLMVKSNKWSEEQQVAG